MSPFWHKAYLSPRFPRASHGAGGRTGCARRQAPTPPRRAEHTPVRGTEGCAPASLSTPRRWNAQASADGPEHRSEPTRSSPSGVWSSWPPLRSSTRTVSPAPLGRLNPAPDSPLCSGKPSHALNTLPEREMPSNGFEDFPGDQPSRAFGTARARQGPGRGEKLQRRREAETSHGHECNATFCAMVPDYGKAPGYLTPSDSDALDHVPKGLGALLCPRWDGRRSSPSRASSTRSSASSTASPALSQGLPDPGPVGVSASIEDPAKRADKLGREFAQRRPPARAQAPRAQGVSADSLSRSGVSVGSQSTEASSWRRGRKASGSDQDRRTIAASSSRPSSHWSSASRPDWPGLSS